MTIEETMKMFTQLANAVAYAACYAEHHRLCTGRPLNRRDFATLMCAAGITRFVEIYS